MAEHGGKCWKLLELLESGGDPFCLLVLAFKARPRDLRVVINTFQGAIVGQDLLAKTARLVPESAGKCGEAPESAGERRPRKRGTPESAGKRRKAPESAGKRRKVPEAVLANRSWPTKAP